MSDCRARRIMKGFRSCGRHDHNSCMMFLSLFGSAPGLPYGEALLFSIFLERFAPLLQGLVQGEFAVV